jgi:hypothetical protein
LPRLLPHAPRPAPPPCYFNPELQSFFASRCLKWDATFLLRHLQQNTAFGQLKETLAPGLPKARFSTGTDVMIIKIFSQKNLAKKLALFAQTAVSVLQKFDHNIGFEKCAIFRIKLAKIAENCDENIDPSLVRNLVKIQVQIIIVINCNIIENTSFVVWIVALRDWARTETLPSENIASIEAWKTFVLILAWFSFNNNPSSKDKSWDFVAF